MTAYKTQATVLSFTYWQRFMAMHFISENHRERKTRSFKCIIGQHKSFVLMLNYNKILI